MIRHLLRLVWHRKRANGLIILEIFLSFLVVFAVVSLGVVTWIDYHRPVGFQTDDVWYVTLRSNNEREWLQDQMPLLRRLLAEFESMDEVETAVWSNGLPFDGNTSIYGANRAGIDLQAQYVLTTVGYADVFGLQVVQGRWFEPGDAVGDVGAVVIDRDLARAAFGNEDPIGHSIPIGRYDNDQRVVGVIDDFRKDGELGRNEVPGFVFELMRDDDDESLMFRYGLKLRPDVSPRFEEQLLRRVETLAPQWSVGVTPLNTIRAQELRLRMTPVLALATVAVFLLLMVGLGLIGVLWQNVTRRTRELGLRRAVGAHRGAVQRQILVELMLVTAFGVLLGVLVVVQVPMLDVWESLTTSVLAAGLAGSIAVIFALALLCGFYPSWIATRVQPAEALHHD